MICPESSTTTTESPCHPAENRLRWMAGQPLVFADWQRVLFLHYKMDAALLRVQIPPPFELELHHGKAVVSLVALTMQRFRPGPDAPCWARLFSRATEQRFFNLRTYVRHRGDSGAFFFWSWLSRPWGLPLPARPLGLACAFAKAYYRHEHEQGELQGMIGDTPVRGYFDYHARIEPGGNFVPCPADSLAEFALERYTGYFWHKGAGRAFTACHRPWLQAPVEVHIEEDSLVARAFPWFQEARLVEAHYAPGIADVGIGMPYRLVAGSSGRRGKGHGPSAFYRMP